MPVTMTHVTMQLEVAISWLTHHHFVVEPMVNTHVGQALGTDTSSPGHVALPLGMWAFMSPSSLPA